MARMCPTASTSRLGGEFRPWRGLLLLVILSFAVTLLDSDARAQSAVDWWSTDNGGQVKLTVGPFIVGATIGQPDASIPVSDSGLTLTGGFWTASRLADLGIMMAARQDPVVAGESLTLDVSVVNRGAGMSGQTTVDFTLPPVTEFLNTSGCMNDPLGYPQCTLGPLAAGEAALVELTVAVDSSTTGSFLTGARVDGDLPDPDPGDNLVQELSETAAVAVLDLAIESPPGPFVAGQALSFSLQLRNDGPSDDGAVSLTLPFPPELDCAWTGSDTQPGAGDQIDEVLALVADAGVDFNIDCAIDPAARDTVAVTATAQRSVDGGQNAVAEQVFVLGALADLSVSLQPRNSLIERPGPVVFDLEVINAGPSTATDSSVSLALPDVLDGIVTTGCLNDPGGVPECELGTIPPGQSLAVRIDARLDQSLQASVIATALVSGSTDDPDPENNFASAMLSFAIAIPALSAWGFLLLALTLCFLAWARLRPHTMRAS